MKYITLILTFISLYSCGQDIEKDLPEKNIYQVVKDKHITNLETLQLKGNIKSVVEKYRNINDTIIDFSKYELTNSDIEKEPWFISPNITKYYKANFNKQGDLTNSIGVGFGDNDTIRINYTRNKENLLISKEEISIEYHEFFDEPSIFKKNIKYIYNEQNHLIKIASKNGYIFNEYEYYPQKMQVKDMYISNETGSLETAIKTYDKYGLKLSEQYFNYKNEKGDLWVYEYDRAGKLTKEKFKGKDGREFQNKKKTDTSVKVYRFYDKNKNCIERIIRKKDGSLSIRTLNIEYY